MHNIGQSRLRIGRTHLNDHYYHITSVTKQRTPIFSDFDLARKLTHSIRSSDELGHTKTLSFCIMPDHFHWLFILNGKSLSQVISRTKSDFSRQTGYKVWQDGFHDHHIRSEDSLINVARYIVANPLRGGLVESTSEYPHWDSIWLE